MNESLVTWDYLGTAGRQSRMTTAAGE
jgi:hypothetical protein